MPERRKRRRSRGGERKLSPGGALALTTLAAFVLGVWFGGTRGYLVPSESMEPTLLRGDLFRADVIFAPHEGPRRGQIWVIRNPKPEDGNGETLVKRVVGLPGETVSMRGGRLWIDGKAQDESYCREMAQYETRSRRLGAGEYWVLGDNRNHSEDSHAWGPIGRGALIGRAFLRYWPLSRLGAL